MINSAQDYSQHLSAREQEHVARMTNSPLINLAGSNNHQHSHSQGGLVSAIEAREQERKAAKEGYGGYMVQQAVAQRQQQGYQQQQPPQHSPCQYSQPSPQMHIPGQFPITPQLDQQQYFNSQYAQSQYGQVGYNPGHSQQGVPYQQQYSPQQSGGQYRDPNYYSGGR